MSWVRQRGKHLSHGYCMKKGIVADFRSLPTLSKRYPQFFDALALLQRAILIMWLAEVLLLSIETGENLGTNTDPDFQPVASVFSR